MERALTRRKSWTRPYMSQIIAQGDLIWLGRLKENLRLRLKLVSVSLTMPKTYFFENKRRQSASSMSWLRSLLQGLKLIITWLWTRSRRNAKWKALLNTTKNSSTSQLRHRTHPHKPKLMVDLEWEINKLDKELEILHSLVGPRPFMDMSYSCNQIYFVFNKTSFWEVYVLYG